MATVTIQQFSTQLAKLRQAIQAAGGLKLPADRVRKIEREVKEEYYHRLFVEHLDAKGKPIRDRYKKESANIQGNTNTPLVDTGRLSRSLKIVWKNGGLEVQFRYSAVVLDVLRDGRPGTKFSGYGDDIFDFAEGERRIVERILREYFTKKGKFSVYD